MDKILTMSQARRRSSCRKVAHFLKSKLLAPTAFIGYIALQAISADANAHECLVVQKLSDSQVGVIVKAYHLGEPDGYGYTLAAIAWQESLAGVVKVNAFDPSFGIFHINLTTASKREGITSNFSKNMLAQRLIDDDSYNAYHAMQELDFWKAQHKGNWRKMWASYNGGWNWKKAGSYAEAIATKIKIIRKCLIVAK